MRRLLIALLLCCAAFLTGTANGQAPGTAERPDINAGYRRPDLKAPLFDALTLPLKPAEVEAAMLQLLLVARNLPDSAAVNHRLRAHALAVALRLNPNDRSAVVANGQLARGVTPSPVPVGSPPKPDSIAHRLFSLAFPLLSDPEKSARDFSLLLLDIARQLDPGLQPRIFPFTYGATPEWFDSRSAPLLLDAPPTFQLLQAEVRVLLPSLDKDRLRTVTVRAVARPAPKQKGLKLVLPEALRREIDDRDPKKEPLRLEVERRMTALRTSLRLRHEVWPEGWIVEISVPDAEAKTLPQLFAGMALTMDSLLGRTKLEANGLLAAGMDTEGKLRSVLPVEELLAAAAILDPPPIIVLPPDAGEQIDDWLILHPDQWPLLFRLTLHRVPAIADAMALLTTTRAPMLERALISFAEVATRLRSSSEPRAELRRPETIAALRQILSWHPQHLSASGLLRVAAGGAPSLSVNGSLLYIDRVALCVLSTDRQKFPLHLPRPRFDKSDFGKAGDAVSTAMKIIHPAIRPYAEQVIILARMLDRVAGHWNAYLKKDGPPDPPEISRQRNRVSEMRATLHKP